MNSEPTLYRTLFNRVLRNIDPERAHHLAFAVIRALPYLGGRYLGKHTAWQREPLVVMGIPFRGPFGVAAGFDKNARAIRGLGQLGFSHVEIGTVTPLPQSGNDKPRLFRLTADRALVNRMGFNNDGVAAVAKRLTKLRSSRAAKRDELPVIGVNIGKNKTTANDDAADDYRICARELAPLADYLAINVSSPNTPALRDLQAVDSLRPIVTAVLAEAGSTPVLLKIAPDLADEDIRQVAMLVSTTKLAGVIATNTTVSRSGLTTASETVAAAGDGGLSGAPLAARSLEVLRLLASVLHSDRCIVSVGGVESADDVVERLGAGANLVQGYTGFVYAGPLWVARINRAFVAARTHETTSRLG